MASPLFCAECQGKPDVDAAGWRGYLIETDADDREEVVFFCPACVEREFLPDSDGRGVGRQPPGT